MVTKVITGNNGTTLEFGIDRDPWLFIFSDFDAKKKIVFPEQN